MTVTGAVVVSIEVTPVNPTLPDGLTRQFTATATFSDLTTADVTDMVTWSSSQPAAATVSNAPGSRGLATGVSPGTTEILAHSGPVAGTTILTVTDAVLVSIEVTPTNPTLPSGFTQHFIATGTYSDGSTQPLTDDVTWVSSDPPVASISNAAGSRGIATGVSPGTTTITATYGGIVGATTLTVTDAFLVSIEVTPPDPSVETAHTQQFTAIGNFSDGSSRDLTEDATWSPGDPTVASVSNAAGTKGLATGVSPGTTNITATHSGVAGTTSLTVT